MQPEISAHILWYSCASESDDLSSAQLLGGIDELDGASYRLMEK